MKTKIIILLDESLSMRKKRNEVIGGFNAFLREQKRLKCDTSHLYLIKFNTNVNIVYSGKESHSYLLYTLFHFINSITKWFLNCNTNRYKRDRRA